MGMASDRIGRKIPMLIGMFGLGVATILFAFGINFYMLLIARLFQGFVSFSLEYVLNNFQ
jgi:DHA1 family solute carrier family 18 vesicular amine transporter 1/2